MVLLRGNQPVTLRIGSYSPCHGLWFVNSMGSGAGNLWSVFLPQPFQRGEHGQQCYAPRLFLECPLPAEKISNFKTEHDWEKSPDKDSGVLLPDKLCLCISVCAWCWRAWSTQVLEGQSYVLNNVCQSHLSHFMTGEIQDSCLKSLR